MRAPLEVLVGLAVATVAAITATVYFLRRKDSEDLERRRRALIESTGRIVEGSVSDFGDGVVVYRWSWRGVEYEASQDVRSLAHRLPADTDALIGPVSVRFLPKDPANSIVLSERWSGFRTNRTSSNSPE